MKSEQQATKVNDVALYKRTVVYLRPYKRQFALVIFAMVATALAEPALAALVKPLLDGSFVDKDPLYITYVPLALLAAATLRAGGGFVVGAGMNWVSEKVAIDIRDQVFSKLMRLPTSYYDEHSTGEVISQLIYHVENMKQAATQTVVPLVKDSVTVVALLVWMLYLNWKLTLTIFILAPVIVFAISRVSRRLRYLSREMQSSVSIMMQTVEESVRNHKAVKVSLAQDQEQSRAMHMFDKLRRIGFKLAVASGANAAVIQVLSAIALASVVYFSSLQSLKGEVTVGGFVSFFGAMALMLSPIKRLAQINAVLQRGLAAAESVFGVLDRADEPAGGDAKLDSPQGKLEFRNVSFAYPGHEELALRNISFTAGPNETVAIVGLSGGGKSTIATLIPLLHHPTSGVILLDGINTSSLSLPELRKHISYVTQEVLLFNDSVRNNIAYGLTRQCSDDEVLRAAAAAHATEFINTLPDGMDTCVGQAGQRLSGGQRQRLAIARAILKGSRVMVFDEATSALDGESERKVQRAIESLRQDRTLIIIAHRLSTIESADRILVVDKGTIVESGTHSELLQRGEIYPRLHSLLRNQMDQHRNDVTSN